MKEKSDRKQRLGIFVLYDRDGIVDNYVILLLEGLVKVTSELVIVCNGGVKKEELIKLQQLTPHILERENKGYDVAAWKFALFSYKKQNEWKNFDEIILCNDSFYGFIYSLPTIFAEMDKQDIDFWGLTEHEESFNNIGGVIPRHIQSFFMVVKKNMFESIAFREYWKELFTEKMHFWDAVYSHELRFTQYFEERGYRGAAYVNTPFMSMDRPSQNYNIYFLSMLEIVRDYGCPIVKRKALCSKILQSSCGEEPYEIMQYLEWKIGFDVSCIWQNLIRTIPLKNLYEAFHLNYELNERITNRDAGLNGQFFLQTDVCKNEVPAFLLTMIQEMLEEKNGVSFFWKEEDLLQENIVEAYDMIGQIGLKDILKEPKTVEVILQIEDILENMLAGPSYLNQLYAEFSNNKFLGIVYPLKGSAGAGRNAATIQCSSWWCKPELYHNSRGEELTTEQFIKERGFLYGSICTTRYRALILQQNRNMLDKTISFNDIPDIFDSKDALIEQKFLDFLKKIKNIFIYGAGLYGRRVASFLADTLNKDFVLFVVSDGQPLGQVLDHKVITFSEYVKEYGKKDENGLLIALSKKNQMKIFSNVQKAEVNNIYFL